MRLGIIGAGKIAMMHMSAVRAIPDATLVGVHDASADAAEAAARRFGCDAFSAAQELYPLVDGVVIATPNHTHAELAVEAVRHGRHVLCEKPMAATTEQAAEMARVAAGSNLACYVGFNYRYLLVVQKLRRLLGDLELGTVHFIELALRRGSALTRTHFTWRDSALGRSTSGALGDLGIHLIDLLHFLLGSDVDPDLSRVKLQRNVPEKGGARVEVDDYAFVTGRLGNGAYFNLTASKSSLQDELGLLLRIVGERREFWFHSDSGGEYRVKSNVSWERGVLTYPDHLDDPPGEVRGWGNTFYLQLKDWVDVVVRGKRDVQLADFQHGLCVQQTLGQLLTKGDARVRA